ncbi:MAG TPA: helix-turn-helix transcriptional regulator [Puia sp.]|jgi:DNA-binding XRE family transcriptional regulator|nr:helix-turn-helix transcriptional regulator [Puia sp.]
MQNTLMKYCRISHGLSAASVAPKLGVDACSYKALECGEILMTPEQAKKLGRLYGIRSEYFYQEALQTDLLLAKITLIKILQNKIKELQAKLGA